MTGDPRDAAPEGPAGRRTDDATLPEEELGGDPACWLNRVCPECGLFVEERTAAVCPRCGADLPRD